MTTAGLHLIVGGDGTIGRALRARLAERAAAVAWTSRRPGAIDTPNAQPLDLGDAAAVGAFALPPGTQRVYLLAGITGMQACTRDPQATRRINVQHAGLLAERAAKAGALPVMVSTNQVFDGSVAFRDAGDVPCPASAYGRQKASLESRVLGLGGVVLRPTKVLPPGSPLLAGWRDALRRGEPVTAFEDLWFSPVPLRAVVEALIDAPPGVTQLSGDREVSYHDAALHLAERLHAAPGLALRGSAKDAGIPPEHRPRHTTLRCAEPFAVWEVIDGALGL